MWEDEDDHYTSSAWEQCRNEIKREVLHHLGFALGMKVLDESKAELRKWRR